MDSETGEAMAIFRDEETGETPTCLRHVNSETGEPEMIFTQSVTAAGRRCFRIPKEYIRSPPDEQQQHPPPSCTVSTEDFRRERMSSVIIFLLPTVFFAPIVAIVLGVLEIILHTWAHKKNKYLRDADIIYQSPLHVIVSEFCAGCIDERMKNKITKMQDRTNNKFTKYGDCFRIVT